jgi:hypothetical protein
MQTDPHRVTWLSSHRRALCRAHGPSKATRLALSLGSLAASIVLPQRCAATFETAAEADQPAREGSRQQPPPGRDTNAVAAMTCPARRSRSRRSRSCGARSRPTASGEPTQPGLAFPGPGLPDDLPCYAGATDGAPGWPSTLRLPREPRLGVQPTQALRQNAGGLALACKIHGFWMEDCACGWAELRGRSRRAHADLQPQPLLGEVSRPPLLPRGRSHGAFTTWKEGVGGPNGESTCQLWACRPTVESTSPC